MIQIENISTNDARYEYLESLLESAFPADERRDRIVQRAYSDKKENFKANILLNDNKPIGLLNYWDLGCVYYIEHFATDKTLRNMGYGKESLSLIKHILSDKPIILETEEPTGDIEKRRIEFYKRNGFILNDIEYKQPPYRQNGNSLDMRILVYNTSDYLDINLAIKELYREVYNNLFTLCLKRK